MSVRDDGNIMTDFGREAELERWMEKVYESNASIVKNLDRALRAGPENRWGLLFPQSYQDRLLKKDKGFATFLDCAESALLGLRENELDETMPKRICRWIESIRGELLSHARASVAATGRDDDGDARVDEGASEESPPEDEPKKKTLVEVENELRKLKQAKSRHLRMMLVPHDKQENEQYIDLYENTESAYTTTKWKAIEFKAVNHKLGRTLTAHVFLDEDNRVNSEDFRMALVKLGLSRKLTKDRLEDLVKDLNGPGFIRSVRTMGSEELELTYSWIQKPEPREMYRDGLVELSGSDVLEFESSPEESKVVIVTGEGGSGKTTFGQYGVKRLIAKAQDRSRTAVIYVPVSSRGGKLFEKDPDTYEAADILLRMLFSQCLRNFYDNRSEETAENAVVEAAYRNVSKLGSKLNETRNAAARRVFDSAIEDFFANSRTNRETNHWWQGHIDSLVLDGLVIVLDGMVGRHRLTRGLVDIARDIVDEMVRGTWCLPTRAKKCKIVLVGSGLEEVNEEIHMTEITDPAKAQVVVAKRVDFTSPDFAQLLKDCDMKREEILHGTLSSVLAENVGMLIDAIVPSMTCGPLSESYGLFGEDLRTKDRIAAGSSKSFMHYVARVYIKQNGLSNIRDPEDLDRVFQHSFLFFAREAIKGIVADDDADEHLITGAAASLLEELTDTAIHQRIFNYGVANPVVPTSRAMKCLACLGPMFPLNDGDELRFKKALPMHLARLSTSLGRKQAGTYELRTAVDREIDSEGLKGDVRQIRSMFPDEMKDIRGGSPWSLVLTQCVYLTDRPDTMELQFHVNDGNGDLSGSLDIYKRNFGEEAYQLANLKTAAIQLGRSPEDLGLSSATTSQDSTDAKQMSDCLDQFVKLLGKKFGINISIRNRVIVMEQSASELGERMETVLKRDVTVWTSEFLEPTFSLFPRSEIRQLG